MYGASLRTLLACAVLMAALSLTGCGLRVRSIALVEDVEMPTLETIAEDAEPGWIAYLEGQDYEINEQFCDMEKVKQEIQNRLPGFLARRVQIQSVRVVSLEFVAETGNFRSVDELDTILTVDDERYVFASGFHPGGLGLGVKLRPKPALNLADAINSNDCVRTYVRISGKLPEDALKFDVVLNYRLWLGFKLF